MGLFSRSKPKTEESEWVEWHPTGPNNKVRRFNYDDKENTLKGGVIWSAEWDFSNYKNVLFCIDEMQRNHKELMDKMDQIINDNKELKARCEALEKENLIKKDDFQIGGHLFYYFSFMSFPVCECSALNIDTVCLLAAALACSLPE